MHTPSLGSIAPGTSAIPGMGVFLQGGQMPCSVGTLVDVGEAHLLHRVQVVQVTPVLLEAMSGRQRLGMVAQVVLAKLAGGVAEIQQELGERRGAGPQIGRAAGKLRRDHARAQRIHAGEEGIAPGGAALHGDIVHEDRALVPDAVDVRGLTDHQATVVDARLHPADVVSHDEQNVGFLVLLQMLGRPSMPDATKISAKAIGIVPFLLIIFLPFRKFVQLGKVETRLSLDS